MSVYVKISAIILIINCFASAGFAECRVDDYFQPLNGKNNQYGTEGALRCLERRVDGLVKRNRKMKKEISTLQKKLEAVPTVYNLTDNTETDLGAPYLQGTFELTAPTRGRSAGQVITHKVLTELCGDQDGCKFGLLKVNKAKGAKSNSVPLESCRFSYDSESGSWEIDQKCGNAKGQDGNAKLPQSDVREGQVILEVGGQCAVAEANVLRSRMPSGKAGILRDKQQDLFLIAGFIGGGEKDYSCLLAIAD